MFRRLFERVFGSDEPKEMSPDELFERDPKSRKNLERYAQLQKEIEDEQTVESMQQAVSLADLAEQVNQGAEKPLKEHDPNRQYRPGDQYLMNGKVVTVPQPPPQPQQPLPPPPPPPLPDLSEQHQIENDSLLAQNLQKNQIDIAHIEKGIPTPGKEELDQDRIKQRLQQHHDDLERAQHLAQQMNDPVIAKEWQAHQEDLNYDSTHGRPPPTPGQGEQDLVMDKEVDEIQFEDEGQIDKDVDVDEILVENEGQEVITIGGDDDDIDDGPQETKPRKKYDKGQKHIMDL